MTVPLTIYGSVFSVALASVTHYFLKLRLEWNSRKRNKEVNIDTKEKSL